MTKSDFDVFSALDKSDTPPPSPFAKYDGQLDMGGIMVDVYVLDTEDRVLSLRGAVKALTGADRGGLSDYLDAKPLQPFLIAARETAGNREKESAEKQGVKGVKSLIDKAKKTAENRTSKTSNPAGTFTFHIPGAPRGHGIRAEEFEQILTAYVSALNAGALKTERQREIAMRCAVMSTAFLRIGIIASIDEVTGYQQFRATNALEIKRRAYILDEYREWEKTFPNDLWEQFGRLTGWRGPLHKRPKWWGHLVNAFIYDLLDPDVAKYLRENKPSPRFGVAYHQWLTADFGARKLLEHIHQIIGIAKGCESLGELKDKVALAFGTGPAQRTMYLPRGGC